MKILKREIGERNNKSKLRDDLQKRITAIKDETEKELATSSKNLKELNQKKDDIRKK